MAVEKTLGIVKPDAVAKQQIGAILSMIERSGLLIKGMKMLHLSRTQAEQFYAVHKERPFYRDLVNFMTQGPVVVLHLEGENAIGRYRELMGPTDPTKAAPGTIRKAYGTSIERNAVHGSDAPETAKGEVAFFFSDQCHQ
jgi:nucleoside-diphosphate kinase